MLLQSLTTGAPHEHKLFFFSGQLLELTSGITDSSTRQQEWDGIRIPRSHVYSDEIVQEKAVTWAERLAEKGHVSKAVGILEPTSQLQ